MRPVQALFTVTAWTRNVEERKRSSVPRLDAASVRPQRLALAPLSWALVLALRLAVPLLATRECERWRGWQMLQLQAEQELELLQRRHSALGFDRTLVGFLRDEIDDGRLPTVIAPSPQPGHSYR